MAQSNMVGLVFNSQVNTIVIASWSVYLTTLFLGMLSPLSGLLVCAHSLARN